MAPPPLDSEFNPVTKIWSGPPEDHDKTLQLGAYLLRVMKTAENQDKIVQVGPTLKHIFNPKHNVTISSYRYSMTLAKK